VILEIPIAAIDLAIRDDLIDGESADHVSNGKIILRQLITREKPHGLAFPEREQADAVVTAENWRFREAGT
jgi:hypothetical protein